MPRCSWSTRSPVHPVAPSGSTTFTITFTPTSMGAKTATVTIANDDSDESSYTFTVNGTGIAPEINVKQGATSIASGGSYELRESAGRGGTSAIVFTVENLGTDEPEPERDAEGGGQRYACLDVRGQPAARIPGGAVGKHDVHDHLHADEHGGEDGDGDDRQRRRDESSYTFTVNGTGIAPEINVKQGATSIASAAVGLRESAGRGGPGDRVHGGEPGTDRPAPEGHAEGGDQRHGRRDVRGEPAARLPGARRREAPPSRSPSRRRAWGRRRLR